MSSTEYMADLTFSRNNVVTGGYEEQTVTVYSERDLDNEVDNMFHMGWSLTKTDKF